MLETIYYDSQRIKAVEFSTLYKFNNLENDLNGRVNRSRNLLESPLIQLRVLLDRSQECGLLTTTKVLNGSIDPDFSAQVVGRIPFNSDGRRLALYYIQATDKSRQRFLFNDPNRDIGHDVAVQRGNRPLKTGGALNFDLEVVDYRRNRLIGSDRNPSISESDAITQLQGLHAGAFETPHDAAQRSTDGIRDILHHNPVVLGLQGGNIIAAGYLERDIRFTFNNIALVEPTYFTDTTSQCNGLSSAIRQRVRQLLDTGELDSYYQSQGTIIFNESIRPTSFILSLRNGYPLAGCVNSPIEGNLGDKYSLIGQARGSNGYMPMGLTYYTNLRG